MLGGNVKLVCTGSGDERTIGRVVFALDVLLLLLPWRERIGRARIVWALLSNLRAKKMEAVQARWMRIYLSGGQH